MDGEYIPKEIPKKEKQNKDRLSGVLRQSLITDLITLLTGLFIFFASSMINQVIGIVVGSFILFIGLYNIYRCYRNKDIRFSSTTFLFSVFVTAVGIFVICSPLIITRALTLMLGIIILIMGISKVSYSILLKKASFGIWLFSLIIGILLIILSFGLIIDPFANIVLTKILGVVLMVSSIADIINLLFIKKESKGIIELHW